MSRDCIGRKKRTCQHFPTFQEKGRRRRKGDLELNHRYLMSLFFDFSQDLSGTGDVILLADLDVFSLGS